MKHISLILLLIFAGYFVVGQINGIKVIGDTCDSFNLTLQATGTSSSPYFFWNFGDPASGSADTVTITGGSLISAPTHVFSGPGVYTVCVYLHEPNSLVTTACRTFSLGLCCSRVINFSDSCIENGTSFTFTSGGSVNSVSWNFGDPASGAANTSTSISSSHLFSSPGNYIITAVATPSCGTDTITKNITVTRCDTGIISSCRPVLPSSFTPNGDARNDLFGPLLPCAYRAYQLLIFNRLGQVVYMTTNPAQKWNGTFKGNNCEEGAYIYAAIYSDAGGKKRIQKGSVLLLR